MVSYWRFGQSRFDQFYQTEIQDLRIAIARDHDVVGLQIPMNDARGMSLHQSFGDVLQVAQQLSQFGSLAMNLLAQSLPIDKLHRDEVCAVVLADFENLRDVGMTQSSSRFECSR